MHWLSRAMSFTSFLNINHFDYDIIFHLLVAIILNKGTLFYDNNIASAASPRAAPLNDWPRVYCIFKREITIRRIISKSG